MTQTRQAAIQRAQFLCEQKPVYLDTETTGIHKTAEIIEICIVDHDGTILLDQLVKPLHTIPADSTAVHGISNEMVRDAPSWSALWPQLHELLSGRRVGIYNADFDLRMFRQSHTVAKMEWQPVGAAAFCIMKLYAKFYGEQNRARRSFRWQSLDKAGRQCKVNIPNSHRAKDDTLLARAVLHYMADSDG